MTDINETIFNLKNLVVEQGSLTKDLDMLQLELRKTLLSDSSGYAVVISGDAGTGKTTLVQKFKQKTEEYLSSESQNAEVVYLETPENPVGKDLYVALLSVLGTPANDIAEIRRLTEFEQKREIMAIIKNKNIRVLILDEFQHATEKLGDKKMRITSDFLKSVINKLPVLLVFAGTSEVTRLLDNEQFESRASLLTKKPITINSKKAYNRYADYLFSIDEHLQLKSLTSDNSINDLDSPLIALPIYYESRGDLRVINDIIVTALTFADMKGSKSLRRSHFVDSWKARYRPKEGSKVTFKGNPWDKSVEQLTKALDIQYDVG